MNDERPFLQAILEQPNDDARKLAYADWLEERGDPRGEYLRLMMKVRQERIVTPEQQQRHQELSAKLAELRTESRRPWSERSGPLRATWRRVEEIESQLAELSRQIRQSIPARLQELSTTLDPNWLAVVSDPEIEGCAKNTGDGWRLQFDFVCNKTWADMQPTDDNKVRHCEACLHFAVDADSRGPAANLCQRPHG
jgi:uncharacterized protein (TIGR02996 family)